MDRSSNPSTQRLIAVAAMTPSRVIGREGRIPWYIKEELQWFKQLTWGHVLVMGRKTFESIGRPLPAREIFVLSRSGFSHPAVHVIHDLRELPLDKDPRKFFICGGEEIYRLALPYCSDLYLSVVNVETEGDRWFPAFEDQFQLKSVVFEHPQFTVYHYINPNPKSLHTDAPSP